MEPLANRLRPTKLDDYVGQLHLVGPDKPIRKAIESGNVFSFILWGPPGTGKTTLARIYANAVKADLYELSAVSAGKDDIRRIVKQDLTKLDGRPQVLFLDEIHRFNKAQQDFLLPFVENGQLVLIGATTENPSFEVIPALLSRLRVFVLNELAADEIEAIVRRSDIEMDDDAVATIVSLANGDARQALTLIDNASRLYGRVDETAIKDTLQSKHLRYDKSGEEHYNVISAYIKSMRAGKPDAAIYYLARMIEGGEDAKFIARRMVIFASEDIGIAQPTALVVANAVFRAVESVGFPECIHNLAHGTTYLANAAKDRSATNAIFTAIDDVKKYGNLPVPLKLRNAPTKLMKEIGYGSDEMNDPENDLLPEKLRGRRYCK